MMKAVFLTKYGNSDKVFDLRETEIPKIADHEVLIKVHSFGLNFADVVARRGMYPEAPKNPAILGYDVAGYVEEVGSGVKNFKKGDRVAALTRFGGYAEYAKTMEEGVMHLSEELSFGEGTALSTQACTALYCAEECVSLHKGDEVLIHAAAGGVGSILVQLAKRRGCIVFGTASTAKQDYLKEIGVDYPIDYTKTDFIEAIKKETKGVDVIFDSIGGSYFKKGMKLLKPGGRMVSFGAADQINGNKTNIFRSIGTLIGFGIYSPIPLLMQSKSIITVNMLKIADHNPRMLGLLMTNLAQLAKDKEVQPRIAKTYKVDQIAEAHEFLEGRKSIGKVVVEW